MHQMFCFFPVLIHKTLNWKRVCFLFFTWLQVHFVQVVWSACLIWSQKRHLSLNVAQCVYDCLSFKCHVVAVYLYLDHAMHVCLWQSEWELAWWQPINSALGDSARRKQWLVRRISHAVWQYWHRGDLIHFKGDSVCPHLLFASSSILSLLPHPWGPSMKQPHDLSNRRQHRVQPESWESNFQQSI